MSSKRKKVVWRLAIAGLVALTAGASTASLAAVTPASDGKPADQPAVSLGAEWNVYSPGPGFLAGFPQAFATDEVIDGVTQRKVFVSWGANRDAASAASIDGLGVSHNGGRTFTYPEDPRMVISTARLEDGSLYSAEFLPTTDPQTGAIAIKMRRSTDLGKTWTDGIAKLVQDKVEFNWIRVHRGIFVLRDGTMLMPIYGVAKGQVRNRSVLLQSTDRGATWTIRNAALMPPTATLGTNESVLSRTSDGRLIALLRADGSEGIYQTYSSDDGVTWTPPKLIQPPAGAPTKSVDPALVLQPNGMLVASYGRPDNTVLVSRDGTGETWDDYHNAFANPPRLTQPARYHGSSANTALVSVGPNQSLLFGDACANIWGCKEYGQLHRVWARAIDAVTPDIGKIDLPSKVKSGTVALSGDVMAGGQAFPEQRLQGATDGSSEPHAAAVLRTGGSLVVKLDREYTLDRIGLMLGYGTRQSADVQLSIDGRSWDKPELKVRDTVDYAMRYSTIEPTRARYVKLTAPDDGGLTVTELELYAKGLVTFENDAVQQAPRGFTDTRYAWVADTIVPAVDSKRRLTLVDLDPEAVATATLPTPAVQEQHVGFQYAGSAYATGLVITVEGKDADGKPVDAWQFHVRPDWTANQFKVSARTPAGWQEIGSISPVPANEVWMPISIDTTATEATMTLNGKAFAPTAARWHEAAAYTGVTVSSWSVESTGSQHEFDDIEVTSLKR